MADSFITVPPDSTGKSLDTRTVPDGNHREVVVVGDPATADVALVDAANGLDVDVTRSALPTGAATAANQATEIASLATIAGDTTDIEAAVELIDDTVAVLGTDTYTEATTKGLIVGAVRRDADTTLVNTTNEISPLQVDANGRLKVEAFSGETLPVSGTVAVTGAGTQYDEDTVSTAADKLTMAGVVRKDTAATLVDTDGDRTQLEVDANGRLHVNGSGVTQPISAASLPLPSGAATSALQTQPGVDIGDVTINNAAGASAVNVQDGGNSLTVDGTVSVTGVATETTLASALTSLQLIDDSVKTLGTDTYTEATTKGLLVGGVRRDADTALVDTTNEVAPFQVDARGFIKVEAFSGETLPVSLTSTTITGTVTADTELPAAAALADNTANPTVPAVGSFLMAFDGTNWDRVQTGAATGGALKVDGSAVTQPVSGTVTANAGTNLNTSALATESGGNLAAAAASLSVLDDWDETDRAKVNPIVGIAGVAAGSGASSTSTQRVISATDDGAVVALQIIDDWDETDRAKVNSIVGQAGVAGGAGATGADVQRVVQANGAGKTILSTGGSASSSGNNTLVAAGTNKLKVFAFSLTTLSTTAMTCIFQSGASGTELWRVVIQAPTGVSAGANLSTAVPGWLFATASATLLNLNLSSANAVHWSVSYYDEA